MNRDANDDSRFMALSGLPWSLVLAAAPWSLIAGLIALVGWRRFAIGCVLLAGAAFIYIGLRNVRAAEAEARAARERLVASLRAELRDAEAEAERRKGRR